MVVMLRGGRIRSGIQRCGLQRAGRLRAASLPSKSSVCIILCSLRVSHLSYRQAHDEDKSPARQRAIGAGNDMDGVGYSDTLTNSTMAI
ncbi:hypothetical protein N657DRAFT_441407 [Parathielavia appendiculata]|uniref:Uncharacterized protein n=1 Tax=Parathielavia appendiculata TaxID=2587402 RepID=A0AAN6TQ42_9PEZI|nr:hypothetical protein N657DRAFT_441407 [Parathielavia appendiculata]